MWLRVKNTLHRLYNSWIGALVVALVVAFTFKSAFAELNHVPTGSMRPTIVEGDRLVINKLAYDLKLPFTRIHLAKWADPKPGDIVVFDSPEDGERLIKRVVAVPGDALAIIDNRLFINHRPVPISPPYPDHQQELTASERASGRLLNETLGGQPHPILLSRRAGVGGRLPLIQVPADGYFVMGDNRDDSRDSRWIGFIPRRNILGRAEIIAYSLDPASFAWPRSHRWFSNLP